MMSEEEVLSEANKARLVTIKSKSDYPGTLETEIRDAETGELIAPVSRVELTIDAKTERCSGIIHIIKRVEVKEFVHTVDAVIKEGD